MSLAGVAFRSSDEENIQVNLRYQRIKDIDSISWPAWDLFDIQQYNEVNQPHGASQGHFMPMLATRGCPFQCTFCTSPNMWTTEWIARDYKNVVDEMQLYQEQYGTSDFQFEDLTAIVRKDWISQLLRRNCPARNESHVSDAVWVLAVSRSMPKLPRNLKAAGCHEFAFAPESGDPSDS